MLIYTVCPCPKNETPNFLPEGFDFFAISLPAPALSLVPTDLGLGSGVPAKLGTLTSADLGLGSGVDMKLGTLRSADWEVYGGGDDVCRRLGVSGCRGDAGLPNDS